MSQRPPCPSHAPPAIRESSQGLSERGLSEKRTSLSGFSSWAGVGAALISSVAAAALPLPFGVRAVSAASMGGISAGLLGSRAEPTSVGSSGSDRLVREQAAREAERDAPSQIPAQNELDEPSELAEHETPAAVSRRLGLGTLQVARQLLKGLVHPDWAQEAGSLEQTPGTLLWPVAEGTFARGFGSGSAGYHLAVDIMARSGSLVRAAASGVVAYAGSGLRGYGNTVLLVHAGGWVTLYAHNSAQHVRAGERVRVGDPLGKVGSTGISRGPHVHFELLFSGRNCDPGPLFRAIPEASAAPSPATGEEWANAFERPESVRCHPRRHHPHSRWFRHGHRSR